MPIIRESFIKKRRSNRHLIKGKVPARRTGANGISADQVLRYAVASERGLPKGVFRKGFPKGVSERGRAALTPCMETGYTEIPP